MVKKAIAVCLTILGIETHAQTLKFLSEPTLMVKEKNIDVTASIELIDSIGNQTSDSAKLLDTILVKVSDVQRSAEENVDFVLNDDTVFLNMGNKFINKLMLTIKADDFDEKQEKFELLFYRPRKTDTLKFVVFISDKEKDDVGLVQSKESYYETLIFRDTIPLELRVFRNSQNYFNVHIRYSITEQNGESTSDSTKTIRSNINLNEELNYMEFKAVVLQLLQKIPHEVLKYNLSTDPTLEFQLSKIYDNILRKIKLKNSPEVNALKDRLEAYEQLDENFRYAGIFKIRKDTITTYANPIKIKSLRRQFMALYNAYKSNKGRTDTLQASIDVALEQNKNESQAYNDSLVQRQVLTSRQNVIRKSLFQLVDSAYFEHKILSAQRRDAKEFINQALRTKTKGKFIIDSVYIGLFNNAVDKMAIYGKFIDTSKGYNVPQQTQYSYPIRANNTSFGLRSLNINTDRSFIVNSGRTNEYSIKLADLLEYVPYRDNYSYIVKDQSFMLRNDVDNPRTGIVLERRALYDYLTVITFLDFLGVNNNVNNNFIQIEGRARFPLKLSTNQLPRFAKGLTGVPMFEAYLNASFINGNNIGGRKSQVFKDTTNHILYYDHFDLLRDYNIKTGFSLGLFSQQYKQIHSRIYGVWDIKMFRTALSYTNITSQADSVYETNVFSLSHGPSLMFEYRPDFNMGADLRFSMDWNLSPFNFRNNELKYTAALGPIYQDTVYKYERIRKKQKIIYGFEFNTYSFLNPRREKNDGLFFRFAVYTNRKLNEISPYILAGYATSLKGLVKKSDKPSTTVPVQTP